MDALLFHNSQSKNILLTGCGGGYDIYAAVPLYINLKKRGYNLFWANYSFVNDFKQATRVTNVCWKVSSSTSKINNEKYFPEKDLCDWGSEVLQVEIDIYSFTKCGVVPLIEAYNYIVKTHQIDTIICVDGGTDALMRGDEEELGTPVEDMVSLVAINAVPSVKHKFLVCIGFGIDPVSHYRFLENAANLTKKGGFYGVCSLIKGTEEQENYAAVVQYANSKTTRPSIINNFICDASNGESGNYHSLERTKNTELFINPLMSMYWSFDLSVVVQEYLFGADLLKTKDFGTADRIIQTKHEELREKDKLRKKVPILF